MGLEESFEEVVKHKAKRMAKASSWDQQAKTLGITKPAELRAFKLGGWDAMIYDVGMTLGQRYARRDFRRQLINKWEKEGI